MANESDISSFSAEELDGLRANGGSRSDLARVRAKSDEELEADIAADPEFRDVPRDWHATAQALMPVPKQLLSLRLDAEVIAWFKAQGPGYQTRMNAVLRAFVEQSGIKRSGRLG